MSTTAPTATAIAGTFAACVRSSTSPRSSPNLASMSCARDRRLRLLGRLRFRAHDRLLLSTVARLPRARPGHPHERGDDQQAPDHDDPYGAHDQLPVKCGPRGRPATRGARRSRGTDPGADQQRAREAERHVAPEPLSGSIVSCFAYAMTSSLSSRIVCCGLSATRNLPGIGVRISASRLSELAKQFRRHPARGARRTSGLVLRQGAGTRPAGAVRSGVAPTASATSACSCRRPPSRSCRWRGTRSAGRRVRRRPRPGRRRRRAIRSWPGACPRGPADEAGRQRSGPRRDREAVVDRGELRCARELDDLQERRAGDPVVGREAGTVVHDEAGASARRGCPSPG